MTEPITAQPGAQNTPLADAPCFIETQFPVAKISMESYKERKAGRSQTLTGLGKWWGRKPLILVRAALLGLLMPASDYPEKDREIFLKLLTMDRDGLRRRKSKLIPESRLVEELAKMPPSVRERFTLTPSPSPTLGEGRNLTTDPSLITREGRETPSPILGEGRGEGSRLRKLDKAQKEELQQLVFERLPYGEKLEYCDRPEQIDGPSVKAWGEINAHLGTEVTNLAELVQELGKRRFGHRPRVGDAFCGGGSIPFEAARLGCDVYGSDLNPVAALLTWASLNLVGGGEEVAAQVRRTQEEIYQTVDRQVTEWGIEHNSLGWRADAYLYCVEVIDPETGWSIPLLPTLAIAAKTRVIARLIPDPAHKRYDIEIIEGASEGEYAAAEKSGTVKDSRLVPPDGGATTPIDVLRRGMRMWEKEDFSPRLQDIFQERLYCIRWVETIEVNGKNDVIRHYRVPTNEDLHREEKVYKLLLERFSEWQKTGFIPSRNIESGYNTDQPIRERGWRYWHQLFFPRQLLLNGLVAESALNQKIDRITTLAYFTTINSLVNTNSKLCRWRNGLNKSGGIGAVEDTFSNQALNTILNPPARGTSLMKDIVISKFSVTDIPSNFRVEPRDARSVVVENDIWITDPPYADAVNYHELGDFFLSWIAKKVIDQFPDWYFDSKSALAIIGSEKSFRLSMVDCYKRITTIMPENGLQIVMFTHQDAGVWADLTMILWAAGLRVTAAWTIATETSSGLKEGNYVQGTVLLILRKRTKIEPVFLDEISHKVEDEVRLQLDEMTRMEDDSDPSFGDADYQLAAYAAALRVLTGQPIEEIDPEKEILRERKPGEVGAVEQLIRRAVKIACDHLIPRGLDADLWKSFGAMERFYIKGLEVESHGEYRSGVYQELARGFGAADYTDLLENTKANETRLKSASEFGKKMLGSFGAAGESFADSLVRQCLFAVWLTVKNEETSEGMDYLHTELRDAYWGNREKIIGVLEYLADLRHAAAMEGWERDSQGAALMAGAVRNDHV